MSRGPSAVAALPLHCASASLGCIYELPPLELQACMHVSASLWCGCALGARVLHMPKYMMSGCGRQEADSAAGASARPAPTSARPSASYDAHAALRSACASIFRRCPAPALVLHYAERNNTLTRAWTIETPACYRFGLCTGPAQALRDLERQGQAPYVCMAWVFQGLWLCHAAGTDCF